MTTSWNQRCCLHQVCWLTGARQSQALERTARFGLFCCQIAVFLSSVALYPPKGDHSSIASQGPPFRYQVLAGSQYFSECVRDSFISRSAFRWERLRYL